MIALSLFLLITYFLITNFKGIKNIKNELIIINSIFFALLIYFTYLYYEYAAVGLKWLESNKEAITTFNNQKILQPILAFQR